MIFISGSGQAKKSFTLAEMVGYYLFLTFLVFSFKKNSEARLARVLLILLISVFSVSYLYNHFGRKPTEVVALDTYSGSSFLIIPPNEEAIGIKGCSPNDWAHIANAYLQARGKENVKLLIPSADSSKREIKGGNFTLVEDDKANYTLTCNEIIKFYFRNVGRNKYILEISGLTKDLPVRLDLLPRRYYYKKLPYNSLLMYRTGAVRIKIYSDYVVIETKRMGKLLEWRSHERTIFAI